VAADLDPSAAYTTDGSAALVASQGDWSWHCVLSFSGLRGCRCGETSEAVVRAADCRPRPL